MCLSELSGCNLIGLASSLSILISQNVSEEELEVLAAFFTALGDNLALSISSKQSSYKKDTSDSNLSSTL